MTLAASDISPLQVDGSIMTIWWLFSSVLLCGNLYPVGSIWPFWSLYPCVVVARVTLVVFGDVASSIPRVMGSPFANTNLLLWATAQKICRNDHCPSGLPARPGGSVLKCWWEVCEWLPKQSPRLWRWQTRIFGKYHFWAKHSTERSKIQI